MTRRKGHFWLRGCRMAAASRAESTRIKRSFGSAMGRKPGVFQRRAASSSVGLELGGRGALSSAAAAAAADLALSLCSGMSPTPFR